MYLHPYSWTDVQWNSTRPAGALGTLGPAYNELGYNENPAREILSDPAITNNFFPQKKTLLVDINV